MRKCYKFIIDLFFPNRCPCCNKIIKWDKLICNECIGLFPVIDKEICYKCGKTNCICKSNLEYDYCFVSTYYEEIIKKGIINLKLENGINFAEFFSDSLSQLVTNNNLSEKIDFVTSVPMTKGKKNQRGYNQAEAISKFIAKRINKPILRDLLIKTDKELNQHNLSFLERKNSVKDAFKKHDKYYLTNKTILLCDDVITTGSTINECARVLKEAGAKSVVCAIIATTNIKKSVFNEKNL